MRILREVVIFLLRVFFDVYFFVFGKPEVSPNLKKVLAMYKSGGFEEFFSYIRIWDAPFNEIEKNVPKSGTITDLGCGEGILTNFLAISSFKRKLVGIEIDKERINQANKGIPNVSFKYGDVTKIEIPKSDVIIFSHLLHHLSSYKKQEDLINTSLKSLKKDGYLIIVEVDTKPFLKYLISLLTDYLLVPWLFDRKIYEKAYFRNSSEWTQLFQKYSLKVKILRADRGRPFSHVIYLLRKEV
jgi:uncharacterized protein